jgi:hypothetical protein
MGDDEERQRLAKQAVNVRGRFSLIRILALWDELFQTVPTSFIAENNNRNV